MVFTDLQLQIFSHTLYFVVLFIEGNCGFPWSDDMDSMNENEDVAETLKTSVNIQKDSHPSISSPYPKVWS